MPVPVTRAIQDSISNLYISILGRNPDPAGFSYWVDQLANQNNTPQALNSITLNFSNAPEFKATYGSLTTEAAVALMYRNVLNRDADAPGLAYWAQQATNYINAGNTISQAYALTGNALIVGAANNAGTADATLIATKQAAALASGNATPVTTYTLTTSSPETVTATGLNNVINGTQATFQASDVINGSASGANTLKLVDTGTAAWTLPAATVTGVQNISLQNINGTAPVAAVTETATVTFQNVGVGLTINLAGRIITATGGTATAADIATAFRTGTTTNNAAVSGTLANYTIAAGTSTQQLVFSSTIAGPVTDLLNTGTAGSPRNQVTTATIVAGTGGDALAAGTRFTVVVNGTTLTTAAIAGADAAALLLSASGVIAAAINAFVGSTIATNALGVVTVSSPVQINIGTPVASVAAQATTTMALVTALTPAAPPTITYVQGVAEVASTSQGDTVTATNFVGATNFISETSTGAVTFNGLAAATQSVTVNGGVGAVTAAFTSGTAATVNVSGAHQTGALTLTGALTSVTLNSLGSTVATASNTAALGANFFGGIALGGNATTLTINAANNLNTGAITGFTGTTATITVAGAAGVVNLGNIDAAVGTINASALSGGVTATLSNNVALAFTGGAGNDTITTGAVLTTGSVNAGGGTGDVLIAANIAHVNTAALAAKYTGFETLRTGGSLTVDASLISGITRIQQTAATNTVANLSASQSVQAFTTAAAASIGNNTYAPVSGTTNTLTLILGAGTTTGAAASTGVLTTTGYQTLNLVANPGPTSTVGADRISTITGAIVDANLTTVNLTGTSFVFTDIATTLATTFNGSALTGSGDLTADAITGLTVGGSATTGSSIIGSNFADSFTLGGGNAVTYNGGLGNDTFSTTVARLGTGTAANPTLIGGTGTDTLTVTGAVTMTDANFKSVSGFERLNLADTTAISITGLTTNSNAAFATGLTVTSGATANGATYTFESIAYANNVTLTLTLAADNDGASAADNVSITTGVGNDTVTVTGAGWVGAAGGENGQLLVSTGAGVDTISVTTGISEATATVIGVLIIGGQGADLITSAGSNSGTANTTTTTYRMAAGDSTTTAYDKITGFDTAGGGLRSSTLDFAGTASITTYAATAAEGFTAGQLTVAVSNVGLVTLAGTSAATLTLAQAIAAVQSVVTANNGDAALLNFTVAGVQTAYVFSNNSAGDSLVELVGVTGATSLITTNATTANAIFVA
jgi:hypothetical protein